MAKVFLSAGHGGSDPGAVAYGMKEKDINLSIMLACKSELERHGVTVICSRTKDEDDRVGSEVKEANASGADIAVSFHTNAGGGDGSESFYYESSEKGERLATLCENNVKAIGQNSRGIKSGNYLYFVKNTKMTAVLCECAFIDNDKDNDIIDSEAKRNTFGVAYAKAILEYFGITYKSGSQSTQQQPKPASPAPTSSYYTRYAGKSYQVDAVFRSIGVPDKYIGSYKKRKPVAVANGINDYKGTESQNPKLISLAKSGKLKRA